MVFPSLDHQNMLVVSAYAKSKMKDALDAGHTINPWFVCICSAICIVGIEQKIDNSNTYINIAVSISIITIKLMQLCEMWI